MKSIAFLVILIFTGCVFKSDLNQFQVDHLGDSNFTINHRELYPFEELIITVNDRYVYKYGPKEHNYWNIEYYKLPSLATKIEVKSLYKNRIVLNKFFLDKTNRNKKIIITVPYPKKFKNKVFKLPPNWGSIPIEKSERDIYLKYY